MSYTYNSDFKLQEINKAFNKSIHRILSTLNTTSKAGRIKLEKKNNKKFSKNIQNKKKFLKKSKKTLKIKDKKLKLHRGSGNTTLTDRINAFPYANKIDQLSNSSCLCNNDESSIECLQKTDQKCCRKLDIHNCYFDKSYPIFIYVPGLGCADFKEQDQNKITDWFLCVLNKYSKESQDTLPTDWERNITAEGKVFYENLRNNSQQEAYPHPQGEAPNCDQLKEEENFKFPDKNFLFVCHKTKVALQTIKDISLSGCRKELFLNSNFVKDFCFFYEKNCLKTILYICMENHSVALYVM